MFRHPKYYKELRKRALDERNNSDQAISPTRATAPSRRATGPSVLLKHGYSRRPEVTGRVKQQAASPKRQASSVKPQALQDTSDKHQAPSSKRQA